jgi:phosphatidate cytidylyltransferase
MVQSPAKAAAPDRFAGLWVRVVSALILAAIGGTAIWFDAPWVDLLVAMATVLMVGEWRRICGGWRHPVWLVSGLIYISAAIVGFLYLRHEPLWGLETALWLVVVVAASDIGAFFTGKLIGGPRLAPTISPGKTWSGFFGGMAVAGLAAAVFSAYVGGDTLEVSAYGLVIAVVSQAGDLLESAVKRRFGFKDAGRVIPGHGGLLDRVDGLAAATLLLSLLRLLQNGYAPWT